MDKKIKACNRSLLPIVFLLFIIPSSSLYAFSIPETLNYDLTWFGIKAGTSSLSIQDNGSTYKITSRADSAKWLSLFYTVRDRVESVITKNLNGPGLPLNYRLKIREGRHRRNKEVIFDHEKKKALYHDYIKKREQTYDVPSGVLDPLTGFYMIRKRDLKVGRSEYVKIFDSKRIWDVEVKVLRKEKVTLPIGDFNIVVVKPLLKSEGIFNRKGDVYIYLTDDERRIPVILEAEVVVGSIKAIITKIETEK